MIFWGTYRAEERELTNALIIPFLGSYTSLREAKSLHFNLYMLHDNGILLQKFLCPVNILNSVHRI